MEMIWHRHLGIYGICIEHEQLLVIHKNGGPYTGRFDLPGGSIEPNESILKTIVREFLEETGISIHVLRNIGTKDFIVPWRRSNFDHTHCHHIAVFYEVTRMSGSIEESPNIGDSLGAAWVSINDLNEHNSSPLVIEAMQWIQYKQFNIETKEYLAEL
ncbi:NUDIX hydrolase [Paenibacillus terrigena]|uniref:NUDIX hydrolase n=1 Tax=Paenibacillus terrigena TaxID=369333 RepID=UPI00035DC473|nr:NUDIX hydrolase [Paenibacillus terrigena]